MTVLVVWNVKADEEGPATHGVVKVVEVLEQRNEKIDCCLVGEPSSDKQIADIIRGQKKKTGDNTMTKRKRQKTIQ